MARPVLIAAPTRVGRKLSQVIGDRFGVTVCGDPVRAAALAAVGSYLAIVMPAGFAQLTTADPILHASDSPGPEIVDQLAALAARAASDQRSRASELAHLAALSYDEYVALARARTTREYLLALLRRHGGVIAEAAREAGLLRETLHRLVRRHDVDPDWFRSERQ